MSSTGWERMAADPSCVCKGGFGEVHSIDKTPFVLGAGAGALPGLSHEDTAILAGVLTGLATFLFLALPILCCLCPLPCCGGGAAGAKGAKAAAAAASAKKAKQVKHAHDGASGRSTDVESIVSFRSFDKHWDKLDKYDYDNLYEVDMKLPRAWVESLRGVPNDQLDARLKEIEAGKWEGLDVSRADLENRLDGGQLDTTNEHYERSLTMHRGESGDAGYGSGNFGTFGRSGYGGDGIITEIETHRQINIDTAASQLPEQEYMYERELKQELSGFDKDNFMKIYWTYKRMVDDTKQTSF